MSQFLSSFENMSTMNVALARQSKENVTPFLKWRRVVCNERLDLRTEVDIEESIISISWDTNLTTNET
jgi:hypothetical protein